jgi:galactonate dehydratase
MRKIAALAEAHYVTVAPHNPMGPLATAVNLHFCAAQTNFKILEYRLPNAGHSRAGRRDAWQFDRRRALRG